MRALIYKPNSSWSTSAAFLCAVAVFGTTVCLGHNTLEPQTVFASPDDGGITLTIEPSADPQDVPSETNPDVAPTPAPDEAAFQRRGPSRKRSWLKRSRRRLGDRPSRLAPGTEDYHNPAVVIWRFTRRDRIILTKRDDKTRLALGWRA